MPHRLMVAWALAALLLVGIACGGNGGQPSAGECPAPSQEAPQPMAKTYPERPPMTIDPANPYRAVINTVRGGFTIELLPDVAPETVNSFVFLAREGYYDGVTFHRVIPGFVAQGGDPTGSGSGGPGYTLPAEFSSTRFERGTVGMARTADPNSGGSQFFIAYAPAPNLDNQYTVFGRVVEGMEVVDCLTPRDPGTNPNAAPGDAIVNIEIQES